MLGLTVDTCFCDVDSNPEVFFFFVLMQNGGACLVDASGALKSGIQRKRCTWLGRLHDEGWRVGAHHTGDEFMSMTSSNSVRSTVQRISSGTF